MANRKKRTFDEMAADNLQMRLEKEAKRKAKELKQLTKQITQQKNTTPTKTGKKRGRPTKVWTAEQKIKRAALKKHRDANRVEFLLNKYSKQKGTKELKKLLNKAQKQRQLDKPDLFKCAFDAANLMQSETYWLEQYKQYKYKDGKPTCPYCNKETRIYEYECRNIYKCKECQRQFNLKTGTIFHKSKIPFNKWLFLMLQETSTGRGLTCKKAMYEIGVTIKTSHAMLTKLRATAFSQDMFTFTAGSTISIDTSAYIGSNVNRADYQKLTKPEIYRRSIQILGMKEELGMVRAVLVKDLKEDTMLEAVTKYIPTGCTIYSDEHKSFANLSAQGYKHETTNHSLGEHARGDISTNGVESFNSHLKTGLRAHNNRTTKRYLQLLINSIVFTLNANAANLTLQERFNMAFENLAKHNKPLKQIAKIKKLLKKQSALLPKEVKIKIKFIGKKKAA